MYIIKTVYKNRIEFNPLNTIIDLLNTILDPQSPLNSIIGLHTPLNILTRYVTFSVLQSVSHSPSYTLSLFFCFRVQRWDCHILIGRWPCSHHSSFLQCFLFLLVTPTPCYSSVSGSQLLTLRQDTLHAAPQTLTPPLSAHRWTWLGIMILALWLRRATHFSHRQGRRKERCLLECELENSFFYIPF